MQQITEIGWAGDRASHHSEAGHGYKCETLAFQADQRDHTKAFNAFSAAMLLRMLAQQCDLEPGELVWSAGDAHIYLNHAHLVEETLARAPRSHPRLHIARRPESIFDYRIEDFAVADYDPHPHIAAPVAV